MNTNIRRAVVATIAASALALVGGGTAVADESSFDRDRSGESVSASPIGPTIVESEDDNDGEFHDDDHDHDHDDDDGLLGIIGLDDTGSID